MVSWSFLGPDWPQTHHRIKPIRPHLRSTPAEKPLIVEMPSREETETLEGSWGLAPTYAGRVLLPDVDVSPNYERCIGEGVAVVLDSRSRVVLLRRSPTDVPHDSRRWVLPSGRIRPSETIEEGTVREVREETGLVVRLVQLLRIDWVTTEFRTWVNKRTHFTFLARPYEGALQPVDREEVMEADWFPADELPGLLQPSWLPAFLRERGMEPHGQ